MGCDIHLFVERRDGDRYVCVPPPADWNHDTLECGPVDPKWEGSMVDYFRAHWFCDRNYSLYAFLADVRNHHGATPLAQPRGLPKGASLEVRRQRKEWGADGHSHTWFTVAELQAALTGEAHYGGWVASDTYDAWKASGDDFPDSWCASDSYSTVFEPDQYERLKAGKPAMSAHIEALYFGARQGRMYHERPERVAVLCAWTVPMTRAFARFAKLLAHLETLGDPKTTRVVFWFDN